MVVERMRKSNDSFGVGQEMMQSAEICRRLLRVGLFFMTCSAMCTAARRYARMAGRR